MKFIFPNDFSIYLHDTPQEDLFKKDVRAFSHGCIRVEHPVELAELVLGWPEDRVRQAMTSGANDHRVNLPHKLPVYIAYFTAYYIKDPTDPQFQNDKDLVTWKAFMQKYYPTGNLIDSSNAYARWSIVHPAIGANILNSSRPVRLIG